MWLMHTVQILLDVSFSVWFWKMRHVLSISACVQTALPSCNQNRCLLGPFMCRNVWMCACVCVCVYVHAATCVPVFCHSCVCMFVWSCSSFPIYLFSYCPCVLFHVCLSAYKYAVHIGVWVIVCACVSVVCAFYIHRHSTQCISDLKGQRKKTHFNRGQFCALSHDLLVSKSNAMI